MDEMIAQLEILHGHLEVKHSKPLPSFLTFPKDSWVTHKLRMLKPSETVFERSSQVLFDAYLVAAFGYFYLGGLTKTNDYLNKAKAVHPKLADRNSLFLLTAGLNEPDLDESILLTRQATEIAPDFQIAQYLLAEKAEKLFKVKNEITIAKVQSVVKEFDRVLSINPGNIAALAELSYLWWLVGDLKTAKKKLEEGFELKSISRETFIGTLAYGLARIAAEEGKFNESYDLYHQGISASLEICTFYTEEIYSDYYGQIGPEIFKR
jgi:tetratricopeptide (TPR) repeat protein